MQARACQRAVLFPCCSACKRSGVAYLIDLISSRSHTHLLRHFSAILARFLSLKPLTLKIRDKRITAMCHACMALLTGTHREVGSDHDSLAHLRPTFFAGSLEPPVHGALFCSAHPCCCWLPLTGGHSPYFLVGLPPCFLVPQGYQWSATGLRGLSRVLRIR